MRGARDGEYGVHFGALAPKIIQQLAEQFPGVTFDRKRLNVIQRDYDAVVRLAVRSMLSEREKRNAQKRVMKEIGAVVRSGLAKR